MRDFFQLVNEYPWTTFWLVMALCAIISAFRGGNGE